VVRVGGTTLLTHGTEGRRAARHELLRAVPADDERYATDWAARARVDGAWPWRPCRVVQIAPTGATIELSWSPLEDILGRVLDVRVRSWSSPSDVMQFEGEIVQRLVPVGGHLRVRVRFIGARLHPEELLELLLRLRPE